MFQSWVIGIVLFYLMALPVAAAFWTWHITRQKAERLIESSLIDMAKKSADTSAEAAMAQTRTVDRLGLMVMAMDGKNPEPIIITKAPNETVSVGSNGTVFSPTHSSAYPDTSEQDEFENPGRM